METILGVCDILDIVGTIAKWLRRQIRMYSIICSSLRAQVQILLVSNLSFFTSPILSWNCDKVRGNIKFVTNKPLANKL